MARRPGTAARPTGRLPLLFFGMLSLLGGVLAGLARLGWEVPGPAASAAGLHGPLMISAFFGTVISLERAVAIGQRWAFAAPLAAGSGGIALLAGLPLALGQGLGAVAALGLVAASLAALRRQPAPHTLLLAVAAGCWLVGNLIWPALDLQHALLWWLLFLILTIAGERLELTRFLPTPPRARWLFGAIVLSLLASVSLGKSGLFAAAMLALAAWLLCYDIARHNLASHGLTRFIAICLFSGYLWLALAGLLGLAGALDPGHPWRDAVLHAIGLGFVFAMVFGHAPIIFPAVTRIRIPYHPGLYVPLALLHLTLGGRVAGSFGSAFTLLHYGALLNALTLVAFVATMITLVRHAARRGSP